MDVDESTVGRTPLVALDLDVAPTVYGKVEWLNFHALPYGGGSVKSRVALSMLDAAERAGDLDDHTVLEPSSGNTGLALTRIAASRGYDAEIVSYEGASDTKLDAIREAGGRVRLVDAYEDMLPETDRLLEGGEYYRPNQYGNPANPATHELGTGPEIWNQTDGRVTHFVAGVGSGGTVTGVGRALAPHDVTITGYEPAAPAHAIDGLKYVRGPRHHVPEIYDTDVLDARISVSTRDAYEWVHGLRDRYADRQLRIEDTGQYDESLVREHLRADGDFLVGPSGGGVAAAVSELDATGAFRDDDVVVVPLPDRGDRYPGFP